MISEIKKSTIASYEEIFTNAFQVFSESKIIDEEFHKKFNNLLDVAYSAIDNNLRNEAQKAIDNVQQNTNPKSHLVSLFQVLYLIDPNDTVTFEKYFSYIVGYIRRFGNFTEITAQEHLQILACSACCVITKETSHKSRSKLAFCFDELIKIESGDAEAVRAAVASFILKNLASLQSFKLTGALMLLQCLVNQIDSPDFNSEVSQKILLIGNNCVSTITTNSNSSPSALLEMVNILSIVMTLCYKLVAKYAVSEEDVNSNPLICEGYLVLFDKVLLLDFYNTGCSLVCFHSDCEVSGPVNAIKHNVVRGISKIAPYNFKKQRRQVMVQSADYISPQKKKMVSFYGNVVRFLLKETYNALNIAIEGGVSLNDSVLFFCHLHCAKL